MKKLTCFFLFVALFSAFPLCADNGSSLNTVHTYGGGYLLEETFNAIKMLIYGSNPGSGLSATFKALLRISLTIGVLYAIVMGFSKGTIEPIFKGWFVPTLAICGFLLVPRTNIHIKDHLIPKTATTQLASFRKVDDVPLFFATAVSLTSWVSYHLTKSIEHVTHGVNDKIYDWTGSVYAGETLFKAGQVQVNDPILEENIKNFCYHCIYNDLAINPPSYTRRELNNTADLLQFLCDRTNPWLSMPYLNSAGASDYVRCHEGIQKIKNTISGATMTKPFSYLSDNQNDNRDRAATANLFANIGSTAQQLIQVSDGALASQKKFLEQLYLVDAVKMHENPKYSTFRARQLQQTNQNIMGKLAHDIIGIRNLFEALIYFSFPLVVIFSLASFGFKALGNWMQFVLWIMMWPPFFVIINFFIQGLWRAGLLLKFGSLVVPATIFTSQGLSELYSSMEGTASMALFLTPWLSFAIMRGGVGQLVHLANSINAPAQQAAAITSNEQVSGNIGLGNITHNNRSLSKRSGINWDDTATFKQNLTTVGYGHNITSTNNQDQVVEKRSLSNTGTGAQLQKNIGNSFRESYNDITSLVDTTEKSFNESIAKTETKVEDYMKAFESGQILNKITNKTEQEQATNAFNAIEADRKTLTRIKGFSAESRAEAGVSTGWLGQAVGLNAGVKGSLGINYGRSHVKAAELANNINKNMQYLQQISSNYSEGETASNVEKASESFQSSMNETMNLAEQYRSALSKQETAGKALETWENSSFSQTYDLNNLFVQNLHDKYKDADIVHEKMNNPLEMQKEMKSFSQGFYQKVIIPQVKGDISIPVNKQSHLSDQWNDRNGNNELIGSINEGKNQLKNNFYATQQTVGGKINEKISFPKDRPPPEGFNGQENIKKMVEKRSFNPKIEKGIEGLEEKSKEGFKG